jgi:hypothetical protein
MVYGYVLFIYVLLTIRLWPLTPFRTPLDAARMSSDFGTNPFGDFVDNGYNHQSVTS